MGNHSSALLTVSLLSVCQSERGQRWCQRTSSTGSPCIRATNTQGSSASGVLDGWGSGGPGGWASGGPGGWGYGEICIWGSREQWSWWSGNPGDQDPWTKDDRGSEALDHQTAKASVAWYVPDQTSIFQFLYFACIFYFLPVSILKHDSFKSVTSQHQYSLFYECRCTANRGAVQLNPFLLSLLLVSLSLSLHYRYAWIE